MTPAIGIHLSTTTAALALGIVVLAQPKGTRRHRWLGRLWATLMAVAAISSFWITGIGHGRFSLIHLLSVWTLISLALAIYYIRHGRVKPHRGHMVGAFVGLVGAGFGAALDPGRIVGGFFFGP